MPPAFILSQDQTLHERKERPVDSGSTYSKLGSPRATRAGRSAHSIALSGFQGAGRLPERGGRMRCAISGAGLTLSRLKGIASPVGEIFRKKTDEGFSRASRGFHPPFSLLNGSPLQSGHALPSPFSSLLPTQRVPTHYPLHSSPYPLPLTEAHCIVTTHFSLPSPPYSLLFHPSLESDLPSKVGELLEERVGVLCLGELM